MISKFVLAINLVWVGAVQAHPHDRVQQQALVTLGMDRVSIKLLVLPSHDSGAHVLGLLDRNGDGVISSMEATDFAEQVVSDATLKLDGEALELTAPVASVAEIEFLESGEGLIEISIQTAVALKPTSTHHVGFSIAYTGIADNWFVQPFFEVGLSQVFPGKEVRRLNPGAIEILLGSKSAVKEKA